MYNAYWTKCVERRHFDRWKKLRELLTITLHPAHNLAFFKLLMNSLTVLLEAGWGKYVLRCLYASFQNFTVDTRESGYRRSHKKLRYYYLFKCSCFFFIGWGDFLFLGEVIFFFWVRWLSFFTSNYPNYMDNAIFIGQCIHLFVRFLDSFRVQGSYCNKKKKYPRPTTSCKFKSYLLSTFLARCTEAVLANIVNLVPLGMYS